MRLTGLDFDQSTVLDLMREAGALALSYFGKVRTERKHDNSVVTAADRAVEALVRKRLAGITPGFQVLGEEAGYAGAHENGGPTWVLDPVDGTSAFAAGLPVWAVSLGLIEAGRSVWGAVCCPMLDELVYTDLEGTVRRNGQPFPAEAAAPLDNESVLYVPSDVHRCFWIDFPGKVRSLGSAAYHGLLTGRAGTAGSLQGKVYLWDAAAILAINRAWGMRIATLDGAPVTAAFWSADKSLPEPILFCRPEHFDSLTAGIKKQQPPA
ncbi:inositol monophosphatase family protein [bacterium]|nr:inositol monophosphatase family protein [bacterium]